MTVEGAVDEATGSEFWEAADEAFERAHRPRAIVEFVGQSAIVANLKVATTAARGRGETLDHLLLCGPPGLGKTTLAAIVAAELQAPFKKVSGPTLERPKDLAAILARMESGTVLFVDEIHRMGPTVEEMLYPAMEDFQIDLIVGEGPAARSLPLNLQPFTLVGATTRTSLISRPLLDRFGMIEQLDYYSSDELVRILLRYADKLATPLDSAAAELIAARSRGTPRIALGYMRRVRDYAEVHRAGAIDVGAASEALAALGVDELGLTRLHRRLLEVLVRHYDGGPTGLSTLAAAVGEDARTLEDVVEPFLIRMGLLDRTPRGRVATARACDHIGLTLRGGQAGLFDGR